MLTFSDIAKTKQLEQYGMHAECTNRSFTGSQSEFNQWVSDNFATEQYICFGLIPNPFKNRTLFVWYNGMSDSVQYEVSLKN